MDWFNKRLDLQVRDIIRNKLKGQYFRNIEIWRLFGANVTLKVWHNYQDKKSIVSYLRDILMSFYLIFLRDLLKWRFKRGNDSVNGTLNPIALEVLTDEKRIRDFWLPLAESFDTESILLVTPYKELYNKFKDKFNIYFTHRYSISDWVISRLSILKFIIHNFFFLFQSKEKYPLSGWDLINIYTVQINYVIRFEYLIKKYRPTAFVTSWDWYFFGSAGTMAFKSHKIPTFTFIHGAGGKEALKEFVPINADYIFSWGKINTNALLELGVKSNSILEVGCSRVKKFRHNDIVQNDTSKLSMLIILSSKIDPHFEKDIIDIVDFYSLKFNIVIRIHPSTSIKNLNPSIKNLHVKIVRTNEESISETILKSDIVITDTTSAAFDVVNLDKPLFIVDSAPIPRPQDIVNEIVSYNAAVFTRDSQHIIDKIDDYLKNNSKYEYLKEGRKRFVADFISYVDDDSVRQIKKSLLTLSSKAEIF